jgi:hypothetical protein
MKNNGPPMWSPCAASVPSGAFPSRPHAEEPRSLRGLRCAASRSMKGHHQPVGRPAHWAVSGQTRDHGPPHPSRRAHAAAVRAAPARPARPQDEGGSVRPCSLLCEPRRRWRLPRPLPSGGEGATVLQRTRMGKVVFDFAKSPSPILLRRYIEPPSPPAGRGHNNRDRARGSTRRRR